MHWLDAGGPRTKEWLWSPFFVSLSTQLISSFFISYSKLNLSIKLKHRCVSGDQPMTRHQDGEKLARPAGKHTLLDRNGVCESPHKCSRTAAITAPSVVHGTGVDRWGTGGTRPPPHFSACIGNVPPTFSEKKNLFTSSDINFRLPSGKSLDELLGWPLRGAWF